MNIKKFGKTVRKRREELCLSTTDLSELIDVTSDYICMIERGARRPSLLMYFKICDALKTYDGELLWNQFSHMEKVSDERTTVIIGEISMNEARAAYKVASAILNSKDKK